MIRKRYSASNGFTLLEMSFLLGIIGLVAVSAFSAWSSFLGGRKIARTESVLEDVRDCLLQRVQQNGYYPVFDNGTHSSNASLDVDFCIADRMDAWGGPVYFLEGRANATAGLQGLFIVDNEAEEQNGSSPDPDFIITDVDGNDVNSTAFVLISFGRDRAADNDSYGDLFGTDRAATMGSTNKPNFHEDHEDDVVLIVTAPKLAAELAAVR